MKRIINGKRYDTETARKVAEHNNGGGWRDFRHVEEALYCKRTGEYFLAGSGGPQTRYAERVDQNSWSGGEGIIPLTDTEAREWGEAHMTADEYEAEFGPVEEPESPLPARIRAAREAAGVTQAELAKILGTAQSQIVRYETGQQEPTVSRLQAIAKALKIKPSKLLD